MGVENKPTGDLKLHESPELWVQLFKARLSESLNPG